MTKRKLIAGSTGTSGEPHVSVPFGSSVGNQHHPPPVNGARQRGRSKRLKVEEVVSLPNEATRAPSRRPVRGKLSVSKSEVDIEKPKDEEVSPDRSFPERHRINGGIKSEDVQEPGGLSSNDKIQPKIKRRRKTKEEKEAEAMPLAARTAGHRLVIGAHVSSAGGVSNAILNSVHIGANAFALFLKSQRKWENPPLVEDQCTAFHDNCKKHVYDQGKHVVPHGSYLVNLAHTDQQRTEQAYKSFLDDLKRCERLGIKLYNFHPGVANSVGGDRSAAIRHLAGNINRAHRETESVTTLLENMAAGGNVLGSTFEDLRDIIALINDKDRVGVCLDTCHAFAGGYDLRSPSAYTQTMTLFEEIVGFKYLRAVHMNDSKAPLGSNRDLHANIGTGFLGLRSFHNLVNDSRFKGIPLILETPIQMKDDNGVPLKDEKDREREDKDIWAREIKLLEDLVGMDSHSDHFAQLEASLARRGEPDRQKLTEQIERKREKERLKADRVKKRTKHGKAGADSESDSTSHLSDAVDEEI